MLKHLLFSLAIIFCFINCNSQKDTAKTFVSANSIVKLEMNLSAFGVESDNFPSIAAYIDFQKDSNNCERSYYNPAFKSSSYKLSNKEMKQLFQLLMSANLKQLKSEYTVTRPDQPTSTTKIYAGDTVFTIKDYGLQGEDLLQQLYKIVYKF